MGLAVASAWTLPEASAAGTTSYLRDSVPDRWEIEIGPSSASTGGEKWWRALGDATLDSLMDVALANNYDVLAAAKRIKAAEQMSRATKAGYYPTLDIAAGYSRQRMAGAISGRNVPSSTESYFSLGLSMNWEIDVFGRIYAQLKSDKANYRATVAEYDAAMVSLVSNLAKAYFSYRLAQAQLQIAENNVKVSEELLHLAKTRYDVGLNPQVDYVQAQMSLNQTKATIPSLKADIATYLNQIATLTGVYPDRLTNLSAFRALPEGFMPTVAEDPAAVIRRRPDVAEAEQELAMAAAKVGIARKDFLPSLSVSAGVGTEARDLRDLFGRNSLYYSVMPTLSWTLFDGMARDAQLAEARYDFEAQIESYNLTVMTAVEEVNNAMVSWQSVTEQLAFDRMILNEAKRVLELQVDRYRNGLNDFNDVAEAQEDVLNYENNVASSEAAQLAALVTLYTALGI